MGVLDFLGGGGRVCIYLVSFLSAFSTALGRGFLMRKPPLLSQRFADAVLCGVIVIPLTGIALEEHGLSIWWIWASTMCFGSLGFTVFYEFIKDLVPGVKNAVIGKLQK